MYTVFFSMEAFRGEGKVALISVYFFFCNLNSFSKSLPFPGKRKINLNQGKINFEAIHNKFYIHSFFLLLMRQCSSRYIFFGLNNSELTSISSFGEICISLNAEYVELCWELG